jgi:hypothetical protein
MCRHKERERPACLGYFYFPCCALVMVARKHFYCSTPLHTHTIPERAKIHTHTLCKRRWWRVRSALQLRQHANNYRALAANKFVIHGGLGGSSPSPISFGWQVCKSLLYNDDFIHEQRATIQS